MLKQVKFPPLPRPKPVESQMLKIKRITAEQPFPPQLMDKLREKPYESSKTIAINDVQKRKRPLSSRSMKSVYTRESSSASLRSKNSQHNKSLEDGGPYLKIPKVTAKSWILYQMKRGRCIFGKLNFKRREIASLTKMLNLITILELTDSLKISASKIRARASQRISNIIGTTAELKENGLYSLQDLYYGMMLPSGNDAATMIAQIGGYLVKAVAYGNVDLSKLYDPEFLTNAIKSEGKTAVASYIREMNRLGRQIGMLNTNLVNPHGLSNQASYSTASDLAKLCAYAMKNQQFRKIVNTKKYAYTFQVSQDQNFQELNKENVNPNSTIRSVKDKTIAGIWENTNRMLGEGWSGIKTGITPNAGPCLAASCRKVLSGNHYEFLVILLSSESMQARWRQVSGLVDWAIQYGLYQ